jgi:hypothetical protein
VKWVRRNPTLAAAVTGLAAALLAGTAVSTYFGIDAVVQAERARSNESTAKQNEEDAITARNDLAKTNATLTRMTNDLETTLARSLLRPLGLREGNHQPMTDPEWEALWELASHRGGSLGYRFVEEACKNPVTSR